MAGNSRTPALSPLTQGDPLRIIRKDFPVSADLLKNLDAQEESLQTLWLIGSKASFFGVGWIDFWNSRVCWESTQRTREARASQPWSGMAGISQPACVSTGRHGHIVHHRSNRSTAMHCFISPLGRSEYQSCGSLEKGDWRVSSGSGIEGDHRSGQEARLCYGAAGSCLAPGRRR